jgi:hypothetical protein
LIAVLELICGCSIRFYTMVLVEELNTIYW